MPPATTGDYMCQCEFKDNNWVHQMTALLQNVKDLPAALQQENTSPQARWIAAQACHEDATVFPNTELIADAQDLVKLQRAALFPSSGGRLEIHHLCLPGQVAMSMVCAQQYVMKRNLRSVLKWVRLMADVLSFVHKCMDTDSPLPFRASEFEQYLGVFQGAVPTPESPSFVLRLAWPYDARPKGYTEAEEPLLECLPLKDAACFPRHTGNMFESCSECCHPRHGPHGHVECWIGEYSYERCCTHAPRPWAIESNQSRCRGADEQVEEMKRALDAQAKEARALGKSFVGTKEDLRLCTAREAELSQELREAVTALNATKKALSDERTLSTERLAKLLETRTTAALNRSLAAAKARERNSKGKAKAMQQSIVSLTARLAAAREQVGQLKAQLQALDADSGMCSQLASFLHWFQSEAHGAYASASAFLAEQADVLGAQLQSLGEGFVASGAETASGMYSQWAGLMHWLDGQTSSPGKL